ATVQPKTQVDLSFKVGGYIDKIASQDHLLQPGDVVTKGQVLVALREADFKAKLTELRGMQTDAASVFRKAKLDYERAQRLVVDGTIPRAEFDAAQARYRSAAGVAVAAGARASQADLALSDSQIKAPFDGVVVARNAELGALVAPAAPVVTIADL